MPGTIPKVSIVADSAEATGLKWAAPAGGGGMTLLSTTTFSGATTTVSGINQTYKHLYVVVFGLVGSGSYMEQIVSFNGSTSNFYRSGVFNGGQGMPTGLNFNHNDGITNTGGANGAYLHINNYASATAVKSFFSGAGFASPFTIGGFGSNTSSGFWNDTTAITSISIDTSPSTASGGTLLIYGVN